MVCLIYLCIFSSEDTGWHIVDAQKTLSEKEKVPQQLGHLVNSRRFQKLLEGSRNLMQGKQSHKVRPLTGAELVPNKYVQIDERTKQVASGRP